MKKFYEIVICIFIVLIVGMSNAKTNVEYIPEEFFGMHVQHLDSSGWPLVKFKSLRLWDSGVRWDNIEVEDNEFNFKMLDFYIKSAIDHNVDVLYTMGMTPTWASGRPNEPSVYGKSGIAAEPVNIELWKRYVRKIVERYRGRIKYYEIWNEPAEKGFFSGDIITLVKMTKEAHAIIKSVDPAARIVCPPSTAKKNGIAWLDEFLRLGGGDYIDIVGYHLYVPGKPELMVKVIRHVKNIMGKHNVVKPIWNTETGWSRNVAIPPGSDAAYVARSYIINWSEGVERFFWYSWDNTNWVSINMINNYGGLTDSAIAYGTIQKWLVGTRMLSCTSSKNQTWECVLLNKDNSLAKILWTEEGQTEYLFNDNIRIDYIENLNGKHLKFNNNRFVLDCSPVYVKYSLVTINNI
ncbi:glycosyl hydrolase [Geobacter benzoatilyticus]|uniref:Asl1-like glycosyl hydrolase catalytic domain-containing protein n=1 Tax=Geobacter benzoatilyticus TaxID=2815309 RepID=A0ABX7Q171_9BACT|nr:glycosyl hydrolase [Geobacter benzoatilyticus]QSV44856.1 hypothetical protein JZM60_11910 [Geobacter benzoatilyticus]